MVSVNPAGVPALVDLILESLGSRLRLLQDSEPPVFGFAGWIGALGTDDLAALAGVEEAAAGRTGAARRYQDVAVLGFAAARHVASRTMLEQLQDGLAWMHGRHFFVAGQPLSFEADGLAVLGLAVGIQSGAGGGKSDIYRAWLLALIQRSLAQTQAQDWDSGLFHAAALVLDPDHDAAELADEAPDLLAALAERGLVRLDSASEVASRRVTLSVPDADLPIERAAARLAALRWLYRREANAIPRRASVADLITVLEATSHALKRWPWEPTPRTTGVGAVAQKWDIQNEYHVQSLLWAILAPIFPDLQDEEFLRSLGYVHPRADLAIPSLKTILEVKFLRERTQGALAGVIGQVASDAALYLSGSSGYTAMVAFVWDHSRSSQHHTELRDGLRGLNGVREAVIVARPGGWESDLPKPRTRRGASPRA